MGMTQKEYQDEITEVIFHFFAAPAVILIGMFAIGAIIDAFLKNTGTFSKIFVYAGGISGIGAHYYDRFIGVKKKAKKRDEK
ncbi:MAG: hypothetical protein P8X70_01130 [Nanoarchaeota archaeon]